MNAEVRFQALDAGLVRLVTHTDDETLPPWPNLIGETPAHVPGWRDWLQQVWAHEAVVEAIEIASPHLARSVDEVCAGRRTRPRRVRRVVESMVRYLLRMHSRATPFGLFAGVAPARIGSTAEVQAQGPESAVARPEPAWLAAIIADLEARPEVLPHLTVVTNNLGFVRADRWILPWQRQPGVTDQSGIGEVSIRYTHAAQTVLQAACSPITVSDLIAKLAAELPGAARAQIERMLTTLIAQRVLSTNVRPPMEATDPLGHVIERLEAIPSPGVHGKVLTQLCTVRDQLTHYGRATSPGQRRSLYTAATQHMAAIRNQPEPRLGVDLRAGETVQLPPTVTREAEIAAATLVALGRHPFGNPAWSAYHARFLERYGSGAVVPLAEITNSESGLGFPAGYRDSSTEPPLSAATARDRTLLRLAQRSALAHENEVELDDELLAELAPHTGDAVSDTVPHTELRFLLRAPNTQALQDGKFTLVVSGAARQAGTLTGRFLHLFEPGDRERMTQQLAGLPVLTVGARQAQVSCPPLTARTQHVARSPAVFPLITLGEHPANTREDITLEELAVTGDNRRLWLVSLTRGCVVEPVMLNAVEFRHATHPLARFLCEITTARAASCKPFEWGVAEALPFLPRLRYRRTVLSPARWNLAATDLPGRNATWPEWEQGWSNLRDRLGLPDAVVLGEHDRRLRLELTEPAHLALLRHHLDRTGHAEMFEAFAPEEYGWIGGRAHEIVLPMAATRPPKAQTVTLRSKPISVTRHCGHLPGSSPWLYARLHAHPDRHEEILTSFLHELLKTWQEGPDDGWWFLRHHEPEPHLRLRLRLHDSGHYGAAAERIGVWAARLENLGLLRGLVLDTYFPEVGRFGVGDVLQSAESAFAADSAAVLAQLTVNTARTPTPQALTVASFVNLVAAFTGGLGPGMAWLIEHPPDHSGPRPPREIRHEALRLADPDRGPEAVNSLPAGEALLKAWEHRRSALLTYRARLAESGGPDIDQVLISLLHLHHTRMIGIDRESERTCLRLARSAALSWRARRERSTSSSHQRPTPAQLLRS